MISRRDVLKLSGAAAVSASLPALAQDSVTPDYRLDIAPVTVDLSPHHKLRTVAYNGQVPGPLLRLKEGRPVTIEVTNHTDRPEVVHWHGLFLPVAVDGGMEEGTPPIPANATARLSFTPRPAGFRWYHTHTMAMGDLTRAQYGGQHGFLMIEPREHPGRYDHEFFLALHDWGGHLLASDDGAMNPDLRGRHHQRQDAGLRASRCVSARASASCCMSSTPARPRCTGSPLPATSLRVLALDGNPVPSPQDGAHAAARAGRARLRPGRDEQSRACGCSARFASTSRRSAWASSSSTPSQRGAPRWQQPTELIWNYEQFARAQPGTRTRRMRRSSSRSCSSRNSAATAPWRAGRINGQSYPDSERRAARAAAGVTACSSSTGASTTHPLHLHRHSFELRSLGAALAATRGSGPNSLRGIIKDVVLVDAHTTAEVEFTADNPGNTLFHCHQQDHMDLGFMMLFHYA